MNNTTQLIALIVFMSFLTISCNKTQNKKATDSQTSNSDGMVDSVWVWNPETEKEELMIVNSESKNETPKKEEKLVVEDGIDSIWVYNAADKTEMLTVVKHENGVPDTLVKNKILSN